MEVTELIGKKVRVKKAIKVCYMDKLKDVVGILTFVGMNQFNKLQCTIDRMPIELKNLNQIEEWKQ